MQLIDPNYFVPIDETAFEVEVVVAQPALALQFQSPVFFCEAFKRLCSKLSAVPLRQVYTCQFHASVFFWAVLQKTEH